MNPTSTIIFSIPQLDAVNVSLHNVVIALQNQPFWNTQLFAALVGAALGLIPSFYILYKDRAQIKVKVNQVLVPIMQRGNILNGFSATISNSGRRSITVDRIFLKFKDGESLIFMSESNFVGGASGLPKSLGEGNSHTIAILAGEVGSAFRKKQCYPIAVCFSDALGNVYECKTSKEFWDTVFKVEGSAQTPTTK